jgi:hypothetical protein
VEGHDTWNKNVCNVRPQKEETKLTRLTFWGNNKKTIIDCGTPTVNLLTVKLLINSVVLTPLGVGHRIFLSQHPHDLPEFLHMKIENFPQDVIDQYKLHNKVGSMGFVILRVEKGMYGLPYANIITHKLLKERLERHGYTQSDKTPGF